MRIASIGIPSGLGAFPPEDFFTRNTTSCDDLNIQGFLQRKVGPGGNSGDWGSFGGFDTFTTLEKYSCSSFLHSSAVLPLR